MINWSDFESFATDGIAAQGKQIHLYTGSHGTEMISHAFAVRNAVDYVEWMEQKKKVDSDTAKNLTSMLQSEDIENFNIALLAIEHMKNEHSI